MPALIYARADAAFCRLLFCQDAVPELKSPAMMLVMRRQRVDAPRARAVECAFMPRQVKKRCRAYVDAYARCYA